MFVWRQYFFKGDRYEVPKGQSPLWSSAEITSAYMNLFASLIPDSDDYMADFVQYFFLLVHIIWSSIYG